MRIVSRAFISACTYHPSFCETTSTSRQEVPSRPTFALARYGGQARSALPATFALARYGGQEVPSRLLPFAPMSRAVVLGVAVIVLIGIGAAFLMRDVPAPASAPAPRPAAPAPAPTPKAAAPSSPKNPAAAEPRKAPPKKAPALAAASPAAPKLATLTIDSDVPGASVFIDRQFVGSTPLSLDQLEPGHQTAAVDGRRLRKRAKEH